MRQLDAVLPCPRKQQAAAATAAAATAQGERRDDDDGGGVSPRTSQAHASIPKLRLEQAFASAAAALQAAKPASGAAEHAQSLTPGDETERATARKGSDRAVASGRRRPPSHDASLPNQPMTLSSAGTGKPGSGPAASDAGGAQQPRHRGSIYNARRGQPQDGEGAPEGPGRSQAVGGATRQPQGLMVIVMGCRVEVDGGHAPTPRVRLDANDTSPGGGAATGAAARAVAAGSTGSTSAAAGSSSARGDGGRASWLLTALDAAAQHAPPAPSTSGRAPAQGAPVTLPPPPPKGGERPVQRFVLDLGTPRPDHFVAQLLVEHELDARRHRCTAWQHAQLDDVVHRAGGRDARPFDVLYAGWAHPGVLPDHGTLVLDVACLPEHASSWLTNSRLHFNAARLQGHADAAAARS